MVSRGAALDQVDSVSWFEGKDVGPSEAIDADAVWEEFRFARGFVETGCGLPSFDLRDLVAFVFEEFDCALSRACTAGRLAV